MSLRTYTFGEEMTEVDFSMATGRSKVDLQPETSRKDEEKMQFAKEIPNSANEVMDGTRAVPVDPNGLTSRELLKQSAEELISDINAKRKRDVVMLEEFKKSLNEQVERAYYSMESSVFACYDNSSKLMQQKLEELLQVLDRIGTHETELEEFKHLLGVLYSDIHHSN